MTDTRPLYNSRIVRMYLEYIAKYHPDVDIDAVLAYAGMNQYMIGDKGYWFNQSQINRFHEILDRQTEDHDISRKAGRYFASSTGMNVARQYALGLMTPASGYMVLGKLHGAFSRHCMLTTKKIGKNKVQVTAIPNPDVHEKPFQCQNRIGGFESLAKFFTKKYATVDHSVCMHQGYDYCQYTISWDKTASVKWKLARNYLLVLFLPILLALLSFLPLTQWLIFTVLYSVSTTGLSIYAHTVERSELIKTIETQGDAAESVIDNMNIRHRSSRLIQEIGTATASILDIDELMKTISHTISAHLDFDYGLIMLANKDRTRLVYAAGFGQNKEQEDTLRKTEFRLDRETSRGIFVQAFKGKTPLLQDDFDKRTSLHSEKDDKLTKKLGLKSVICVPIKYKEHAIGILAVDNIRAERPLTQSDMNLLQGIASQIAISINNAMSYKKLYESDARFRAMFRSTRDCISILDRDLRFVYANKSACSEYQKPYSDIVGKHITEILNDRPQMMEAWSNRIHTVFESGQDLQFMDELNDKGNTVHSESEIVPIRNEDYKVIAVAVTYRDTTEKILAQQEKLRLESQLAQAQKMESIGTLAGGIAHDFNNILYPILGYSQIVLDELPKDTSVYDFVKEIQNAGYRAKDLVQQILTFSRKQDAVQSPVLIQPVIKEVLKLLRAAIPANIAFKTNIDYACGHILAVPIQIHQIIMNLCTNAYYAMKEDGGTLEVEVQGVDDEYFEKPGYTFLDPTRKYIRISVKDTGKGMSPDIVNRIFEPYFTTKDVGEGSGMGLSIVHGIVMSHGGHCNVRSAVGRGTTFDIFFPQIVDKDLIASPESDEQPSPTGTEHILLIDDNKSALTMLNYLLKSLGYIVTPLSSSIEALNAFQAHPEKFDIVVTDMMMPQITGKELIQKILKIRPEIPTILCTGYSDDITEKEAKEIGVVEYLLKPVAVTDLAVKIRSALDQAPENARKAKIISMFG